MSVFRRTIVVSTPIKRFLSTQDPTKTTTVLKENIGLTGIAKNPNAKQDLLSRYTALSELLNMSRIPSDHPYRSTVSEYLHSAIGILKSDKPETLCKETGLQYEELIEEVEGERELMEAMEDDIVNNTGETNGESK
jgi:hypothetical protein